MSDNPEPVIQNHGGSTDLRDKAQSPAREPVLEDAIELAAIAHRGQRDKAGQPYIFHVLRVMLSLETPEERIVAALHDVVEDSKFSRRDLLGFGFSARIVEAVDALTRRLDADYEAYDGYIDRVSRNALATRVKLADLRDNMDLSRIESPTAKDWERHQKYVNAWYRLTMVVNENRPVAIGTACVSSDVKPPDVPGGDR